MRFNDIARWPGYAEARTAAGLTDVDVCRWFKVPAQCIDDWHKHGAPIPVHILFRFMARPSLTGRKKSCSDCPVLEVVRDATPEPAKIVNIRVID